MPKLREIDMLQHDIRMKNFDFINCVPMILLKRIFSV